jgi:hypothetical protein
MGGLIMKELNLEKLWSVCNTLSQKESELCEQSIFIRLMGHRSNYGEVSFEGFLNYYSFRLDGDEIVVFNNDGVSWEDYNNDDFSYIPLSLLSFDDERLENWMLIEIDLQSEKQKRDKLAEKENIKQKIKYLETQLNNL